MFGKKLAMAATMVAVALGATIAVAAPASAAPANCNDGTACQYQSSGWRTGYYNFAFSIANEASGTFQPLGIINVNENISSIYNNGTQQKASFYIATGFKGQPYTLGLKEYNSNLEGKPGWNDAISSACFSAYC